MTASPHQRTKVLVIHSDEEYRRWVESSGHHPGVTRPPGVTLSKSYLREVRRVAKNEPRDPCPVCRSYQWRRYLNRDAGFCPKCGRTIDGLAIVRAYKTGEGLKRGYPRLRHG